MQSNHNINSFNSHLSDQKFQEHIFMSSAHVEDKKYLNYITKCEIGL